MKQGKLYLLPNHLDTSSQSLSDMPLGLEKIVIHLDGLFVESEKGARRFLKCFNFEEPKTFRDVKLKLLNEHSKAKDIKPLVEPMLSGESWGVLSDAGMPCLADPGSQLIKEIRQHDISIKLLHGPSSITHALIVSGFNAQSFAFHGYLPRKEPELISKLKFLDSLAFKAKQTQVFIETPYRNQKLLEILLKVLHPKTEVCIALNLMTTDEKVIVDRVSNLRKSSVYLPKVPAVFLIGS